MELKDLLRDYMKKNHVTQHEFAERIGRSRGYVALLLRGKDYRSNEPIIPKIDTLMAIAKAMNLTLEELLATIDIDTSQLVLSTKQAPDEYPRTVLKDSEFIVHAKTREPKANAKEIILATLYSATDEVTDDTKDSDEEYPKEFYTQNGYEFFKSPTNFIEEPSREALLEYLDQFDMIAATGVQVSKMPYDKLLELANAWREYNDEENK